MSRWEHRYLGQEPFPDALSTMEIWHFFSLSEDELAAVRRRRTVLNRLALALQIGFLKMTGGTLNSVEIIPTGVLEHLGRRLGCAPPRIALIRALYRRRRTLFDHQAAALHTLGRTEPSEHAERGLVAYLRREAAAVFDNVELMVLSRSWLIDSRLSRSARARNPASRRRCAAAPRGGDQKLADVSRGLSRQGVRLGTWVVRRRDHGTGLAAYAPPSAIDPERPFAFAYSITSSARASSQLRQGEAKRLGGLEVDEELELRRLLDGQVSRHRLVPHKPPNAATST
jgi:hypothetical protein